MKAEGVDVKYSMVIEWSDEDNAFLVTLPEWNGRVINPVGHGDTYAEAAESGQIALEHLISLDLEDGRPLPIANTRKAVVRA
jgi:predicted RNase H-like HicB family nuclease